MKKVIIAGIASIIAVMSMAGCGGTETVTVTPPASTTTTAAAAAEPAAVSETAAAESAPADAAGEAASSENEFLNNLNKQMEYFNNSNGAADTTAAAETAAAETTTAIDSAPASDDELISMRVGDADHGFITVPKTWVKFQDASAASSGMMQYCDGTQNNIISMMKIDKGVAQQVADQLYDGIQTEEGAAITGSRTCEVDGKEAYRIDVRYEAELKEMYVWVVQAEGAAYYLAVEYTDPDVFELARTYSTEK